MRSIRDLALALRLLTVFALPSAFGGLSDRISNPSAEYRRSVAYFTWVGALLGAVLAAAAWVGHTAANLPDNAVALMLVVTSFIVTRGMHWDALSDVADAWWGSFSHDRRLEIMSDSHVGAFGVFALVAAFTALLAADTAVLQFGARGGAILIGALGASRSAAVFGAYLGQPAKRTGLGASISGRASVREWAVALVGGAAVCLLLGASVGAPVLALETYIGGSAVAAVAGHLIALRMGGTTGDVLGAGILLSEIVTLAISAWMVGNVVWWG